jgi:hypothetical protein
MLLDFSSLRKSPSVIQLLDQLLEHGSASAISLSRLLLEISWMKDILDFEDERALDASDLRLMAQITWVQYIWESNAPLAHQPSSRWNWRGHTGERSGY